MSSPFTELFANCTHVAKGFMFSKGFIIPNELILFSLGRVVSWLVLLGEKLKLKSHGVTCSRSPRANPGSRAHNSCPGAGVTLIVAFVGLCCQPSVTACSLWHQSSHRAGTPGCLFSPEGLGQTHYAQLGTVRGPPHSPAQQGPPQRAFSF